MGTRAMAKGLLAALLVLMTVAFVGTATSGSASACSCGLLTDDEAFMAAEAVFTGELVEVRGPTVMLASDAESRFIFAVERVFKGEVYAIQSVVSASDGASCGLELQTGVPVVVYAGGWESSQTPDEGEYSSGLCSGSRTLAAGAVPASFGDGAEPLVGSSPIGADDSLPSELARQWYWSAAGVICVVLAVVLVVRHRRRRDAT